MKPIVEPLAYWRRKLIFILLLLAFLFCLPVFMFYATGYRYDFFSGKPIITATGGLYIAAEAAESKIFVDEEEVINARVFRNASYIQGLPPSLHRVHVQAIGRHTWVKNLSVYRHIVTEAESFNLPLVPQVRPVTQYQTARGEAVFVVASTTLPVLPLASSSIAFVTTTSTATSTYRIDPEYTLLNDLFAEQASTTAQMRKVEAAFGFATSSTSTQNQLATTTVIRNNIALYKNGEEVFAQALGVGRQIPHYFCTSQVEISDELAFEEEPLSAEEEVSFENTLSELSNNTRECRTDIRIDRLGQMVHDFDFFPVNEDLVLLNLDTGVYVVEIDDRSWQNAQLLYPGKNLELLVYSGGVFIKDKKNILEVLPDAVIQ